MPLNACLFAVAVGAAAERRVIEDRLRRLVAYYAPLGEPRLSCRWAGTTVLGAIRFDGAEVDLKAPFAFGDRVPARLDTADALLHATDGELRSTDACLALFAADEGSLRIVTGPVPPTTLYGSEGKAGSAWSTHATAAAFLAGGKARINRDALPELVTAELVGGNESIIEGVFPVALATSISIDSGAVTSRSYWPARDRWAPVPETDAVNEAEHALLTSLDRRLAGRNQIVVGMTAGLDSRVTALALQELGVRFSGYTWGVVEDDDVNGARALAQRLGVEHRYQPIDWYPPGDEMRRIDAGARWAEGGMPVGFGTPTVPAEMATLVTGAGGETGRAFYYRYVITSDRVGTERLARVMADAMAVRAAGMDRERRELLRGRLESWVDEAVETSGLTGWRALDVLYTQQRVGRWLRTMLARGDVPMIGAFTSPEIARRLASMAWEDRATDAFHRAFIERREPHLPATRPTLRPGRRRLGRLVAPLRRRREARIRPGPHGPSARPGYVEWLVEEVLASPLLSDAVGAGWTRRVRDGLMAGDPRAEYAASWAAAPVAFAATLSDLND